MEIIYISDADLAQADDNPKNIININRNHYWDAQDEEEIEEELFYA